MNILKNLKKCNDDSMLSPSKKPNTKNMKIRGSSLKKGLLQKNNAKGHFTISMKFVFFGYLSDHNCCCGQNLI